MDTSETVRELSLSKTWRLSNDCMRPTLAQAQERATAKARTRDSSSALAVLRITPYVRVTKHQKQTGTLKHRQGCCEISDTILLSENMTTDTSVCSQVVIPLVFGFSAASRRGQVILGSGSMGAVDQLACVRHQFWLHGIPLSRQLVCTSRLQTAMKPGLTKSSPCLLNFCMSA